ncbi:MAG: dihydrofolate reductase family protein [Bacteroidia bacterium]|nr:dihydrofolate reductase family protein [Bacteroidia bacterium]
MRKIIVLSMISLDGIMQGPGGPKEDPSGGFKYGGWTSSYKDEVFGKQLQKELVPADYLLGRKTFKLWAGYWPEHGDFWPHINSGMKYVFSKKLRKNDPTVSGWKHSEVIRTVADIKRIKNSRGKDLHVWGSTELIQLLLKNDLVDELLLKIYPLTLGKGKRLFSTGPIPAAFTLTESVVTTKGVIIAYYKRAGKIKTGNVEV